MVCVHYVWVVRSAPGWWFGGVTVLRVEGLRLVGCEQSFKDLVGGYSVFVI